jgi:adenosyl cobinamide kinase/adenosyl cobinamide phosphate guanylyltransferase
MIVLVLGGTRSGKSEVAERLAARAGDQVTVIVPAVVEDDELCSRVDAHRARRPPTWSTIECGPDVIGAVAAADGPVLLDSLGTWVAGSAEMAVDVGGFVEGLRRRTATTIIVTEEVGLAVHASTDAGRRFTDVLGELNAAVAAVADRVLFVVAGRLLELEDPDRVVGDS